MDMNKMLQQVAQVQEQMAKAQEEVARETVEASAGGGMVTVTANGALQQSLMESRLGGMMGGLGGLGLPGM